MLNMDNLQKLYKRCVISVLVAQSCLTVIPWSVAHQAPLSMEFSRQEYWVAIPFSRLSS